MSDRNLQDSLGSLSDAVAAPERALTIPREQEPALEGAIRRFEIVIGLTWKTPKRGLEGEGFTPKTPRDGVGEAFRIGWLHDETAWLDMPDHRSTTSHPYLAQDLGEKNYVVVGMTPVVRTTPDFPIGWYGEP